MIDVSHAELHTATVELKMITVDQRQMTLSVFRQIPQQPIIDGKTFKLNGVPWGWVNYFWPEIKFPYSPVVLGKKVQVVWQKGTALYRAVVFALPATLTLDKLAQDGRRYLSNTPNWMPYQGGLGWTPKVIRELANQYDENDKSFLVRYEKLRLKYNAVVKALMELDQLFIAVGGGGRSSQ